MSSENFDLDSLTEARSKAIEESINTISVEQMKSLGEGLLPYTDHPWRERYFKFITENAGATFHHATTNDQIHILYCRDKEQGVWFRPGGGMGPLQEKGLGVLKKIVDKRR